ILLRRRTEGRAIILASSRLANDRLSARTGTCTPKSVTTAGPIDGAAATSGSDNLISQVPLPKQSASPALTYRGGDAPCPKSATDQPEPAAAKAGNLLQPRPGCEVNSRA